MPRAKKKRGEDWIRDEATLAGRITNRMEELELSPTDLAAACGVSVTAVGWWLRGDTKNLKLDYFFKLADKLKVADRWLGIRSGPKQLNTQALGEVRDHLHRLETILGGAPAAHETTSVMDSTKSVSSVKKEQRFKKP